MRSQNEKEKIIIIDFGSQLTKLIARRIRELGVFSEIINIKDLRKIENFKRVRGIILSGGPSTVTKKKISKNTKKYIFKRYSCSWYMLLLTINCKDIWWFD